MKTDTATIQLHGITVHVEFEYTPPYRAPRDKYGAPESPDGPATIEIVAVRHGGIDIIEMLSDTVLKALEKKIRGREQ